MKSQPWWGAACLASLLLMPAASPADAPTPQRHSVLVPFTPLRGHGVPLVQVRINDKFTGTFMIDTGASDCIITDRLAKQIGLKTRPAFYHGFLPFGFGDSQNEYAPVDRLQIGKLTLNQVPGFVVIRADDLFRFPEQQVDGIIGGTVLSHFTMLVDFPRHRLELISPGGLTPDEVHALGFRDETLVPLRRERIVADDIVGSAPVVAGRDGMDAPNTRSATEGAAGSMPFTYLEQNIYHAKLSVHNGARQGVDDLIVDTGAPDTSVSQDLADRLGLVPTDKQESSTMFNGSVFGNVVRVSGVQLGGVTVPDQRLAYPGTKDSRIPPLLGEDVLAYCIALFDFPKERLYLYPTLPPLGQPTGEGQVNLARLRAAARIPAVGAFSVYGDAAPGESVDLPARIDAQQKALKGDSSDADRSAKLGDLYAEDRQTAKAQAAYAKAAALYAAQVKPGPGGAALLAREAEALTGAGSEAEAEKAARQATILAPGDARCWIALGRSLHAQSVQALTGAASTVDLSEDLKEYQALVARLLKDRPGPDRIAHAQALSLQARAAFDKAVAVAPDDAQAYKARAAFAEDDALGVQSPLRELRGEQVNLIGDLHSDAELADLERFAALKPDDPEAQSGAAYAAARVPVSRNSKGLDFRESKFLLSLPKRYRESIRLRADRLTALSRGDKAVAAKALAALGDVQRDLMGDDALAEATYRHALTLDPGQPSAAVGLAGLLSSKERYADIQAVLETQLKGADTVQTRLLLARTLDKEEQSDRALEHARAALKMRPDDYLTNLTLAALLLRHSEGDAKSLNEAGECLLRAQQAMSDSPSRAQQAQFSVMQGIYLGLSGDAVGGAQQVLAVLNEDRGDTDARDVIAALTMPGA